MAAGGSALRWHEERIAAAVAPLLPGFARVFESTMKRRRKMMNKHKVKKRKRAQRMKAK